MISKKHNTEEKDSNDDDLIRLKSQILALHELLDVADNNVIQQASLMEHLNAELEEAKKSLENIREDTNAYLMHDINNQLVGQRMLLEHLVNLKGDDELSKIANSLLTSNKRIRKTIRNLVSIDEYDSDHYNYSFKSENIRHILNLATKIVKALADAKLVAIKTEFEDNLPALNLDKNAFTHALTTILENTIRNSLVGQKIHIQVFQDGNELIITVSDTTNDSQSTSDYHLFERFWQSDRIQDIGEDQPFELFIASQIVKEHHGKMYYDSTAEAGIPIRLVLPINQ